MWGQKTLRCETRPSQDEKTRGIFLPKFKKNWRSWLWKGSGEPSVSIASGKNLCGNHHCNPSKNCRENMKSIHDLIFWQGGLGWRVPKLSKHHCTKLYLASMKWRVSHTQENGCDKIAGSLRSNHTQGLLAAIQDISIDPIQARLKANEQSHQTPWTCKAFKVCIGFAMFTSGWTFAQITLRIHGFYSPFIAL